MSTRIHIKGRPAAWETLDELLEDRARTHAERHAMEICGHRLTYGELAAQARRVAGNLHRLGVSKGDHVATFMANRVEQVLTWFGVVKLGAIWAPFNAALVGDDLSYTLQDTKPRVLIVADELRAHVDALSLPEALIKVVVGGAPSDGYLPFDALLEPSAPAPAVRIGPADPAVIMYTGGTTGMPKGVVLPHFAWIAAGYRYQEAFGIRADDSHYSILKLFHNGALMLGIIGPMVCAIPTTIDERFSVSNFWARIRQTRATVIDMVPTSIVLLAQAPQCPEEIDNTVRISVAPIMGLPPELVERFRRRFGIALVNLYAQSEAGGVVTIFSDPDYPKLQSNGRERGWAQIGIFDERDVPVPPGVTGQICLRPLVPHMFMTGYLNKPEKTVETFANLWLHTGDYGYVDADGDLFFTGRQIHWLRRRGENISAHEVERTLLAHPAVAEAVVVGVPSALGDEEVKAFVIAKPDASLAPADLAEWCRSRIAAFKVPRYIQLVEAFPRSSAKAEVERFKLKAMDHAGAWDAEQHRGSRP